MTLVGMFKLMAYIQKTIIPGEKIIQHTKLHWIYLLEGVFWLAALIGLGVLAEALLFNYAGVHARGFEIDLTYIRFDAKHTPLPWLSGFAGLAVFIPYALKFISNEIAVTSQRVIHKTGLVFVKMNERDLEDIRGEIVNHGLLGIIFGYGRIHFDCRFVEDMNIPAIGNPYRFVKESHKARMQHPLVNYTEKELCQNIDAIEERRLEAETKQRLKTLALKVKNTFRKVH